MQKEPWLFFLIAWLWVPLAGAEVLQIDSDFDGKMDQWHEMSDTGQLVKVEYDTNGDGQLDQVDVFEGNKNR